MPADPRHRRRSPVAAIDCGTNSTRLLVLGPTGSQLDRQMRITRLGAGVDRSGTLDRRAIERTLSVLADFRVVLEQHHVPASHLRAAATSATRDAANAGEFLDAAEQLLGVRPEVIEGLEEGRLSYAGATASLERAASPYLVVDIGGGSTELIVGVGSEGSAAVPGSAAADGAEAPDPEPAAVASIDVGCVRITERYLESDPPAPRELESARAAIKGLLAEVRQSAPAWRTGRHLVGLAGTVSALTVLSLGLEHYDAQKVHHARISRPIIAELTARLASLPLADRLRVHGIEPERADVIVGGALVLEEVMDEFRFDEVTCSESDILDGIAHALLAGS